MRLKSWVKVQIDCLTGRWAIGALLTSLGYSLTRLAQEAFAMARAMAAEAVPIRSIVQAAQRGRQPV